MYFRSRNLEFYESRLWQVSTTPLNLSGVLVADVVVVPDRFNGELSGEGGNVLGGKCPGGGECPGGKSPDTGLYIPQYICLVNLWCYCDQPTNLPSSKPKDSDNFT